MSDQNSPVPLDVRPAKQGLLRRLSIVWFVPLIALAVSLGVAWQSYSSRGPLIEITFDNASGISADETVIKYRDVDVGRVEDVTFSDDLEVVIVSARMDPAVAPFLDDDAQFWVVEPDVSVRGISGLETVLSGVFILGSWDSEADVAQSSFVGLDTPPINFSDSDGTSIVLRARDGSALASGAPILHKGIQVGYLEKPRLDITGQNVMVDGFIEAPYDERVTTSTRFWDTSGFSISFGAGGVSLDVNSLASLIEGGVAFDTVFSGGAPISDGHRFNLFPDSETARESLFDDGPVGQLLNVGVLFDGSVNGLIIGSEVRFRGIVIGEVIDINAVSIGEENGTEVRLRAILGIDPSRIGMSDNITPEEALDVLADFVAEGLRARLATGNILSGALVVQLFQPDRPEPGTLDRNAEPYPLIPSAPAAITDVADTADDVLRRINDLPIEELMASAIGLMNSVEQIAQSDELLAAPESIVALAEEARILIASDDIQSIAPDLRAIMANLAGLVSNVDGVVVDIADADVPARLTSLLTQADILGSALASSSESWPQITQDLQDLISSANALELDLLITQANSALGDVNTFLASDGFTGLTSSLQSTLDVTQAAIADVQELLASNDTQAIPKDVRALLASLQSFVTEVQEGDVITKLNSAAESAVSAADAIETGAADLPAIVAQVETLMTTANDLELAALVKSATETLNAIDTLLLADSTQALPQSIADAADELQQFLAEVREGGAITNVNAALASANSAAQAIEDAAESLPALSARASALVSQTQSVVDSYSERSRFNQETLSTLRDIQSAADAISALARTIQRNPSSLLTGR